MLSLPTCVVAVAQLILAQAKCTSPPSSASTVAFEQQSFDYLIIGAGAGGLPVAARLSANSSVSVGLIEAGSLHLGDQKIEVPRNNGEAAGDPTYDWIYSSVPQTNAGGTVISYPRGKLVGGSTALNGFAWDRASKEEYDVWATLSGSDDWNWDGLLPFFAKVDDYQVNEGSDPFPGISGISPAQLSVGSKGVVPASHQAIYPDPVPDYVKTWNVVGAPTNADPYNGNSTGVYNTLNNIDRTKGIRSYAGNTYYVDISCRPNLKVITGAQATQIVFDDQKDASGNLVARSVIYNVGNATFSANATKEIVLSGGSFNTPQLLELSGIGNATLLQGLGITPLVDLPGVGENLQDHLFIPVQYQMIPGIKTFDELRINATFATEQAALYNASHTGWLAAYDSSPVFLPFQTYVEEADMDVLLGQVAEALSSPDITPLQKSQYEVQQGWIEAGNVPQSETIMFSEGIIAPADNTSYVAFITGPQHPFSRGSVHINSIDPLAKPVIDTNALSSPVDVSILIQQKKLMDRFSQTAPFSDLVAATSFPGANLSDAATLEYIKETVATGSHPMGTAALAKRELGGVVDGSLKVYGTSNLRIADASVIPLAIATHLQATVYAIGEKAADMIKRGK